MHMNFLAIIVATLVPMIVGFIYYNPKVLGGAWMKANGFTLESVGAPPKPIMYGAALLLSFLLSGWLCLNVTGPGQQTAPDGHSYATFGHGIVHGIIITISVLLPYWAHCPFLKNAVGIGCLSISATGLLRCLLWAVF